MAKSNPRRSVKGGLGGETPAEITGFLDEETVCGALRAAMVDYIRFYSQFKKNDKGGIADFIYSSLEMTNQCQDGLTHAAAPGKTSDHFGIVTSIFDQFKNALEDLLRSLICGTWPEQPPYDAIGAAIIDGKLVISRCESAHQVDHVIADLEAINTSLQEWYS